MATTVAGCRSWIAVMPSPPYGRVRRLVCSCPAGHRTDHHRDGWSWYTGARLPVREWVCRGLVSKRGRRCGRTELSSEDEARTAGWRIGWPRPGEPDPICPRCSAPPRPRAAL